MAKFLRLKKRRDFPKIASLKKSRVCPAFILQVANSEESLPRIGFTASKKIGGAVQRSRAKRRLRALSDHLPETVPGRRQCNCHGYLHPNGHVWHLDVSCSPEYRASTTHCATQIISGARSRYSPVPETFPDDRTEIPPGTKCSTLGQSKSGLLQHSAPSGSGAMFAAVQWLVLVR